MVIEREPEPAPVEPKESAPASSDLRDLRREIGEAHAIATRTYNAVSTLAGSLKEVIARQNRYDRGLNLNSFIAYVLFTVLLGGGFFLLYRSRAERLVADRDEAIRGREAAINETRDVKKELASRDESEQKAEDYWSLFKNGKRAEAIAQYPEIAHARLTSVERQVFEESVAKAREDIIDQGFSGGVEAFEKEQWKAAATSLKRALGYESDGPRASQMRYYYGVALHKQGDYAEAEKELVKAIDGGVERTVGPDARFYLANALEMLRQTDRAKEEYEKFLSGHPSHPLAPLAYRKIAELAAAAAANGH
jgi:TolA-binding protein